MYRVAGLTFITGYQDRRFLRISFNSSWGYLYFSLLCVLLKGGGRGRFFFIEGMGGILIRYLVLPLLTPPPEGGKVLSRTARGGW